MTPREIDLLATEFFEQEDIHSQRFGAIAASAWNAMRGGKRRDSWKTWKDFFVPFAKRNRSRGMTHEQMMQQVQSMKKQVYGWKN